MDVIVTLERPIPGESSRQVKEIVEIRRSVSDGLVSFAGLNRVFTIDKTSSEELGWARDGAFTLRAQEQGADSHVAAYEALIDEFAKMSYESNTVETVPIGERIWEFGHPFAYVARR